MIVTLIMSALFFFTNAVIEKNKFFILLRQIPGCTVGI